MGYPDAIMFVYLIVVFAFFMLPLFILGLSAYKCFAYAYPRFRGSTFKNVFLPILSGVLTVTCGYFYLVLAGGKEDPGFRNFLTNIIIVWILTLIFLIAWIKFALNARPKLTNPEESEQQSSRGNGSSQQIPPHASLMD